MTRIEESVSLPLDIGRPRRGFGFGTKHSPRGRDRSNTMTGVAGALVGKPPVPPAEMG